MKLLLIGAGNMGGAMLQGLHVKDITVVEAYPARVKELQELYPTIKIVNEIPSLEGYLVILAIKPQSFGTLHTKGIAEGVISIMAGINLEKLKSGIMASITFALCLIWRHLYVNLLRHCVVMLR